MKHWPWVVFALGVASGTAAASTNSVQGRSPVPARSAAAGAVHKDSAANILGRCYALDTAARHECVYAELARSRSAAGRALN